MRLLGNKMFGNKNKHSLFPGLQDYLNKLF